MNILILSSSNPNKAAGIVAKSLLYSLKQDCLHAKLIVKDWDYYKDKDIIPIDNFLSHELKWSFRKTKGLLKKLGLIKKEPLKINKKYSILDFKQTKQNYSTKRLIKKIGFVPDAIIILFSVKYLNAKNIYELNLLTKAPIFLYLMDMAPMTGGCHYAWDCHGYEHQCGKCPALFSNNAIDQSYINWKFKKEFIKKTNISVIACTEWTFQQLKKSSIFKDKQKYKILLPIDSKIYEPTNKTTVRNELGLPLDKKIIFFGAVSVKEKRKGFNELTKALNILNKIISEKDKKNIHLTVAGKGSLEFVEQLPFSYTLLGYLSHAELPKAFQATDVFVSPSIEDSGPMMINQSIMCGTPVVAFEIGVALDLVFTGKTGYRAQNRNIPDLANGIYSILKLNKDESVNISQNCIKLSSDLTFNSFSKKMMKIINDNRD